MEDTLGILRDGKSAYVGYDTTFLVQWPEHLGGSHVIIDFTGSMKIVPLMGSR